MARHKSRIFLVEPREGAQPEGAVLPRRLVRGTRSEVEGYVLSGLYIEPATPDQAVELGAAGVKVEDAVLE